jgi:hypothetical protein
MNTRIARWIGGAALAVAVAAGGPAQASTLQVTGATQPGGAHNVTIGNLGNPANGTYSAGRFALTTNTQGTIHTWCVDVFRTLHTPQTYQIQAFVNPTVTNGNPTGPVTLTIDQVNAVKGLAAAGNAALDTPGANTGLFAGYGDNIVSAAVQAAIWEVINPAGTFVGANGNATSRGQVNALFGTLTSDTNLAQFRLQGQSVTAAWLTAVNPQNGRGQGQIWVTPGGGGGFEVPVPTPAALLVFALGLVGLAAARRVA